MVFNFGGARTAEARKQGLVPIVLVTLEVTHTVLVTDTILHRIAQLERDDSASSTAASSSASAPASASASASSITHATDEEWTAVRNPFLRLTRNLLLFFAKTYRDVFAFREGPPLHDPVALYYCLAPEAFATRLYRVDVECAGTHTRGQTVVDIWNQTQRAPNVHVCERVDVDAFWNDMLAAIQRASKLGVLDAEQPLERKLNAPS